MRDVIPAPAPGLICAENTDTIRAGDPGRWIR